MAQGTENQPISADLLFYKKGDVLNGNYEGFGYISNGSTEVIILIPLPKSMELVRNCTLTISNLKVSFRSVNGTYVGEVNWWDVLTDSTVSISSTTLSNNVLWIIIKKTTGNYGITNNTPTCGRIEITLTFS